MANRSSIVFVTMPTSGTGSLWRLMSAIAKNSYSLRKISEEYDNAGRGGELVNWIPEKFDHIYMYNTPHHVNAYFHDPQLKLITNFRDPRDLSCNQFYWALQHPVLNKSPEEIERRRAEVRAMGIDEYVKGVDNNLLFRSLQNLKPRVLAPESGTVNVSYAQLCLDFEAMIDRLVSFIGVDQSEVDWSAVKAESPDAIQANQEWIGKKWTGSDVMPGRHRYELKPDTIRMLDKRYRDNLAFCKQLEARHLAHLYAGLDDYPEAPQVLTGRKGFFFLQGDANNTVRQIAGESQMPLNALCSIAFSHRNRETFASKACNGTYRHAIIPSKEVVYRKHLPAQIAFEHAGPRPVRQYLESMAADIWRPYYSVDAMGADSSIEAYPKTDTHWTHQAAYGYLENFFGAAVPELAPCLAQMPKRTSKSNQQGDLALKIGLGPEEITLVVPQERGASLVFDNKISNEGRIQYFRCPDAKALRALILNDSFTMWLADALSEMFKETLFFHGTIFDFAFVEQYRPSHILCIQAERFFPRVPETGGDMIAFVKKEETAKKATVHFAELLEQKPWLSASAGSTSTA